MLEVNKQKETSESKSLKLKGTIVGLIQDIEKIQEANETLKKPLQEAQADIILVGDDAF